MHGEAQRHLRTAMTGAAPYTGATGGCVCIFRLASGSYAALDKANVEMYSATRPLNGPLFSVGR